MLWRRHHPQAQVAGEAEGGKEEDAELRQGRYSAGGLHCSAENGRELVVADCEKRRELPVCDRRLRTLAASSGFILGFGEQQQGGCHAPPSFAFDSFCS